MTVYPAGQGAPVASNLNPAGWTPTANAVTIPGRNLATLSNGHALLPLRRDGLVAVTHAPRLTYRPALDGLRALAVAAVLLYHLPVGWAKGGWLGVSAFFVLSGYLITSLLLVEHDGTGRVDRMAFWARRFRRLLPASLACIAMVIAFVALEWLPRTPTLRGDLLAALFDVENWRVYATGGYDALWRAPSPVAHFWSLAIEEQWYVIWPIAVAVLLAWSRRAFVIAVGLGIVGAFVSGMLVSPAAGLPGHVHPGRRAAGGSGAGPAAPPHQGPAVGRAHDRGLRRPRRGGGRLRVHPPRLVAAVRGRPAGLRRGRRAPRHGRGHARSGRLGPVRVTPGVAGAALLRRVPLPLAALPGVREPGLVHVVGAAGHARGRRGVVPRARAAGPQGCLAPSWPGQGAGADRGRARRCRGVRRRAGLGHGRRRPPGAGHRRTADVGPGTRHDGGRDHPAQHHRSCPRPAPVPPRRSVPPRRRPPRPWRPPRSRRRRPRRCRPGPCGSPWWATPRPMRSARA